MEQVEAKAGAAVRLRRGRFTVRELTRAAMHDLAATVRAANRKVTAAERAHREQLDAVDDRLVDRIRAGDALDLTVRLVRFDLASRSLNAVREPLYRRLLPRGVAWFVDARLAHKPRRVTELADALEQELPDTDPVRTERVPTLRRQVATWEAAVKALDNARALLAVAHDARLAARRAWGTARTETYAHLILRVGLAEAERFFARGRRKPASDHDERTTTGGPPPASPHPRPVDAVPRAGSTRTT
jgi:hypothetical protein